MTDILVGNGTVVTLGSDNKLIENGAVLVHDDRIAAVGTDGELRQQHPDIQYIDACSGLIMPGFLCAHTHFYSAFAQTCYTSAAFELFAGSGLDFQEGYPTCQSPPHRARTSTAMQRKKLEEYICRQPEL